MKKIILLSWLFTACSITVSFGQLEGRKFISASAGLNFSNDNQDDIPSSHNYGYDLNVNLGKFKTAGKASGWNISTSLKGEKNVQYRDGTSRSLEGITGFGVGIGYFWQYYKHFSDKFGIFGGPHVNVLYSYAKSLESQSTDILEHKNHQISPQFGLSAGAYYALNDRWWLTGSLGFIDLLYVSYTIDNGESLVYDGTNKNRTFNYKLSPNLALPSVSLGLRYFFKD
ncbi:hypothetical protein [Dyadobacter sp. 676]|uniref:Porin family protein n=1 Tax=Dyadobacter sp. 676 TaxID=3088362 RepID=A0AAU8FQ24_9BACT